jgi:hypothetical protein
MYNKHNIKVAKEMESIIDQHSDSHTYSKEDGYTADGLWCMMMEANNKDAEFAASCIRSDLNGINGANWVWDHDEIIDSIREHFNLPTGGSLEDIPAEEVE